MKKILVLMAFILVTGFGYSSSAHAIPVATTTWVYTNQVQSQLYNSWARPMFCNIYTRGITQFGGVITGYNSSYLMPGQVAYGSVYSYYPYYFVRGTSSSDCYWY